MASNSRISGLSSQSSLSDLLAYFSSDMNSSVGHSSSGNTFTDTEIASYYYDYLSTQDERAYNYALTEDERAYNEYYYQTYESPSAMVQQYQDAGLNPALMYGSGASTTSTNNSSSPLQSSGYGQGSSRGPMNSSYDKLMGILQFMSGVAQTASQIDLNKKQGAAAMMQGEAALTNAATNAGVGEQTEEEKRIANEMSAQMNPLLLENQKIQNALGNKDLSLKDIVAERERAQTSLAKAQTSREDASTQLSIAQRAYTYDMAMLVKEQTNHEQLQNWFDSETMQARIEQQIDSGQITHIEQLLTTSLGEMQLKADDSGMTIAQQAYEIALKQAKSELKLSEKEAKNYALKLVYNMTIEATKTAAMILGALNLGKGKTPSTATTMPDGAVPYLF